MTEKIESEVYEMCNFSKGIEDRALKKGIFIGREEGKEENRIESIISIVNNLGVSLTYAMEFLNVPENEWEKYLKLLEN